MGIGPRISSSWECNQQDGNPDPRNYKILHHYIQSPYLVLEIQYPDCKNYEGRKILLYKDVTLIDLINQKDIDPHFSDDKTKKYPIARFVPNDWGWRTACNLAYTYSLYKT